MATATSQTECCRRRSGQQNILINNRIKGNENFCFLNCARFFVFFFYFANYSHKNFHLDQPSSKSPAFFHIDGAKKITGAIFSSFKIYKIFLSRSFKLIIMRKILLRVFIKND